MTLAAGQRLEPAPRTAAASRRRSWRHPALVVVLLTVLGVLGGAGAATLLTARPLSQIRLIIEPLPGNAFSSRVGDTFTDLRTEAQLPKSDEVLERVAAAGPSSPSVELLRRRLNVRLIDNAEVLVISARADSAAAADALAREVAAATLAVRTERAVIARAAQAALLEASAREAEDDLRRAIAVARAVEEITALSRRVVSLNAEVRAAKSAAPSPGAVIGASLAHGSGNGTTILLAGVGAGTWVAFAVLLRRRYG